MLSDAKYSSSFVQYLTFPGREAAGLWTCQVHWTFLSSFAQGGPCPIQSNSLSLRAQFESTFLTCWRLQEVMRPLNLFTDQNVWSFNLHSSKVYKTFPGLWKFHIRWVGLAWYVKYVKLIFLRTSVHVRKSRREEL